MNYYQRKRQREKQIKKMWDRDAAIKLEGTVVCEYCGKKNLIPANMDSRLCTWCNRTVWNNTKAHFMKKMRTLLERQKKEEEINNGRY